MIHNILHVNKYPTGSLVVEVLRRDRFADNLATGAEDQRAAVELAKGAMALFTDGGFPLKKF